MPNGYQAQQFRHAVSSPYLQRFSQLGDSLINAQRQNFAGAGFASASSQPSTNDESQPQHPHENVPYLVDQRRTGRDSNASTYQCSRSGMPNQPPESNLQLASTLNSTVATVNSSSSSPSLNIDGDLDDMSRGWTQKEKEAKRRVVEFKPEQNGTLISLTFRPVTLEQCDLDRANVSCIFWEDRDKTYVTSIDIIRLLERLRGGECTVDEKGRIRRSLEAYDPLTVAESNPERRSLFELIMDFPPPKPRNIRTAVKVFPWETLPGILQKMAGKLSPQDKLI